MTCWRCGRPLGSCAPWCSDGTPNDCDHCGGNPCRWWCLGPDGDVTRNLAAAKATARVIGNHGGVGWYIRRHQLTGAGR